MDCIHTRKNKTVWEATLNIANTTNGEKILYDIDPIKTVEDAVKSADTSTTNSIHDNSQKSQQKFSDRDIESLDELNNQLRQKQNEITDLAIELRKFNIKDAQDMF